LTRLPHRADHLAPAKPVERTSAAWSAVHRRQGGGLRRSLSSGRALRGPVGLTRPAGWFVMPRHRVSPSASPMTGSSGASSTPRPFDSPRALEYWITRLRGWWQRRHRV